VITHVVLLRFKPGVSAGSEAALALHAALAALPAAISEIRSWRCGFNLTPDAQAADYVLVAEFDDAAALHRYFAHPAHAAVLATVDALADLQFADCCST
jgi:quinol monooxygenase YgiN